MSLTKPGLLMEDTYLLLLQQWSPPHRKFPLNLTSLKCQLSNEAGAAANLTSVAETGAVEQGRPEPAEAPKIIPTKTKILPQPTPNPINGDHAMQMGHQTRPVAAIGLRAEARPTVATPSSVGGPTSLHHALKIEKLACLESIKSTFKISYMEA